jgi:hypothetical protein
VAPSWVWRAGQGLVLDPGGRDCGKLWHGTIKRGHLQHRLVDVRVGEDSGQVEGLELVREAARGWVPVRGLVEGARVARAPRVRDDGRVDREDVRLQ